MEPDLNHESGQFILRWLSMWSTVVVRIQVNLIPTTKANFNLDPLLYPPKNLNVSLSFSFSCPLSSQDNKWTFFLIYFPNLLSCCSESDFIETRAASRLQLSLWTKLLAFSVFEKAIKISILSRVLRLKQQKGRSRALGNMSKWLSWCEQIFVRLYEARNMMLFS